jgi:hypothetical protein
MIRNLFRRITARRKKADAPRHIETFDGNLARAGISFESWLAAFRSAPRLHVDPDGELLRELRDRWPREVGQTIAAANRVLRHRFSMLGSGEYSPADRTRPSNDGYEPIDWLVDPVPGVRFPSGFHHKEWVLSTMAPKGADVKRPWELARCQHFATLAQAWRLSSDRRFVEEIVAEVSDFVDANPLGRGIHWVSTMDVALRAANWAIGISIGRDGIRPEDAGTRPLVAALFDHGEFIFNNFENFYEVTSNHYLSNLVGLSFVAALFCDLPRAREWEEFCRSAIEEEMRVQVLDDGADYESSVPYHRLVAELFLGAARLAEYRGRPMSAAYMEKLKRMVSFHFEMLRPDGRMPQIGDADDGRLHILSRYGALDPADGRHLLGPAGCMFGEGEWLRHAGEAGMWEAAWWGCRVAPGNGESPALPDRAGLFRDAGVAVARAGGSYLAISNGVVGTRGFGNHKHDDQLSFEFHVDGVPLVVDPGTGVYTSDPAARNLFRSARYHNTLRVDGAWQNEIREEWLFRMFEKAKPEHRLFRADDAAVEYEGAHFGYQRLTGPVVHARRFRFDRKTRRLEIRDTLDGRGKHLLEWHFHLDPAVVVGEEGDGSLVLLSGGIRCRLSTGLPVKASLGSAEYSPSYGVRVPCRTVDFRWEATLEGKLEVGFVFAPQALG